MVTRKEKRQINQQTASEPRSWLVGQIFIILLAALLPYLFCLSEDFVFDDRILILQNDFAHKLSNIAGVFTHSFGMNPHMPQSYYRPIVNVSLMLDYAVYGPHATGFRITNLVLHAIVSVLVFCVARRLLRRNGVAPLFAALLFAVHPAHTESTAWISGRTDIIAAIFSLLTFLSYTKYVEQNKTKWLVYAASLFTLALFSKEISLIVPVLLVIYIAFDRPSYGWKKILRDMLPFALISVGFLIIRSSVLSHGLQAIKDDTPLCQRILLAPGTALWYLRILVLPNRAQSGYDPYTTLASYPALVAAGWIIGIGIITAAFLLRKRWPLLSIGIFWTIAAFLPACNIVPLPWRIINERFLYLSSVGFCLICGMFAQKVYSLRLSGLQNIWPTVATVITGAFLLFCGMQTYAGAPIWSNNKALALDMIEKTPNCVDVHTFAGETFTQCGDFDRAIQEYNKVLETYPDNLKALAGLSVDYTRTNDLTHEVEIDKKLAVIKPDDAAVHNDLGAALAETGDLNGAIQAFRSAAMLEPKSARIHFNLARTLAKNGDVSGSIGEYKRGLKLDPNNKRASQEFAKLQKP